MPSPGLWKTKTRRRNLRGHFVGYRGRPRVQGSMGWIQLRMRRDQVLCMEYLDREVLISLPKTSSNGDDDPAKRQTARPLLAGPGCAERYQARRLPLQIGLVASHDRSRYLVPVPAKPPSAACHGAPGHTQSLIVRHMVLRDLGGGGCVRGGIRSSWEMPGCSALVFCGPGRQSRRHRSP